ncbi:MAG: glycosyltransferase [Pararhodobacter sp.]
MASLVMLSPAPMVELPGGEVILDVKFVEGMKLHCQLWPGPVRCVMRRGRYRIEAPMRYSLGQLGFDLIALDEGARVPGLLLDEAALVYAAADDMKSLHLPAAMQQRMGKLVYTVGEPLSGRLAHALAASPSLRRKLGGLWWNLTRERHLKEALRAADGVHFDGFPAQEAYRRLNPRSLGYLDNRLRTPMIARAAEQAGRAAALEQGAPLRLVWVGPVDPLSGVEDLLPMAFLLRQRGVPFRLEMFGSGPLEARIRDGISGLGLQGCVTLQAPGPFDPVLVPHLRRGADLFISPRRLATPQSTYVEALGCGLPILGYGNRMWRRMQAESGAGWVVRRGSVGGLVRALARLDSDRAAIIAASRRAVEFARGNTFELLFAGRLCDLRGIGGLVCGWWRASPQLRGFGAPGGPSAPRRRPAGPAPRGYFQSKERVSARGLWRSPGGRTSRRRRRRGGCCRSGSCGSLR